MSNKTIRILGTMSAITPFHMAHANRKGQVDDNGEPRLLRGPGKAMIPCTMTYKTPILDAESAKRVEVVTLPGGSLRGRIRRECADAIKESWIKSGQHIDRDTYHVLQVLSAGDKPLDRSDVRPADTLRAREDLYAGVFGGGASMFSSTLVSFDMYAICRESIDSGVIHPGVSVPAVVPSAIDLTFAHCYTKKDDLISFSDPLAERVINNYPEAFTVWQELISGNSDDRKEHREWVKRKAAAKKAGVEFSEPEPSNVGKLSIASQLAVEAVIPGTKFSFEVHVTGTDAQIGMVLEGIRSMLSSEKGLGGLVRNGYGRFAAKLDISDGTESGSFIESDGRGNVSLGNTVMAVRAVEAFNLALETYTPEQFNAAYMMGPVAESAKDDATGKKAKKAKKGDSEAEEATA